MPRIGLKPDNLNARNGEFEQTELTRPVFLNSVPKCGTHLVRNIVRMFVPVWQQYSATFIQHPVLDMHKAAFDPQTPRLSWGHLLYSDKAAITLKAARIIVLVRDPYDWVLARARFFLSDTVKADIDHLKGNTASPEDVMNMMIFGIPGKGMNLRDVFTLNAVAWFGTRAHVLRYEDVIANVKDLQSARAETFFRGLLQACGIDDLPEDWRARVEIGADREQSGTARENLKGVAIELPESLPATQRQLVDLAAPGLRALLGYR